ncbi:unnamed protein product [Cochlearia groenlandica]
MEVSVIGSSQARICRSELAYRDLEFRSGLDAISVESRNSVSFCSQSSKSKEMMIRCSPRSVKCEAVVSDVSPFSKHSPKPRSLPIFWGVVEREASGKYDWSGYLAVAEIVEKVGLKLHASLCFHGSKDPEISLPEWVVKIGEAEPGMYFKDRSGKQYKDCLSFAVDDVPVLDGKTLLWKLIKGITLGLGPDDELRYPSNQHDTKLSGAGEFQCYDTNTLR